MARWTGHKSVADVLEAAQEWRSRCLEQNGSILSNKTLWTTGNLSELSLVFESNPIYGTDQGFYEKLQEQLSNGSPEITQLASEAIWFTLLFPDSMKTETKRQRIIEVWNWSGETLSPDTKFLGDQYLAGIGNPGQHFLMGLPDEFGFSLNAAKRFKSSFAGTLGNSEQDAWHFADWLDEMADAAKRPMRNALLYFLFPDQFERNLSVAHRQDIYMALKGVLPASERIGHPNPSLLELDKAILAIRQSCSARFGTQELDFYRDPLRKMWGNDSREQRRKQLGASLESVLNAYNLELNQPGSKKRLLEQTRPVSEETGFWKDPTDATNKPLRWLTHIDLTGEVLKAGIPSHPNGSPLHGARRIAFVNTAQGKSGAVLVRLVPALMVAPGQFEFFETWEWLLLLCFLPNLPVGSAAQLLDDFDPQTGKLSYMGKHQSYIAAALVCLNDGDASYAAIVDGQPKVVTYAEATSALAAFLHVEGDTQELLEDNKEHTSDV